MKFIKRVFLTISIIISTLIIFIAYISLSQYKPKTKETIFESNTPDTIHPNKSISFMIWNIGYAGLGKDMDFFYDGGKQTRTSEININKNLNFIKSTLKNNDTLDFILLQEVDIKSKRSYHKNEKTVLDSSLKNFYSSFAKNYDVKFIPSPFKKPMGKVKSGLLSYTSKIPKNVTRYSFPGSYSWPTKLFMLKRCFLVSRFPVNSKQDLVIINTHNSAYDNGNLKKQEMIFLKNFLLNEYKKGNYIIVGGDWNQMPPGYQLPYMKKEGNPVNNFNLTQIKENYLTKDWHWAFDKNESSNRYLNIPFIKGKTKTTILDYYLLSPNLNLQHIKTINSNFTYTDHHPVICKINFIKT